MSPARLRPTAAIAARAILVGDPGRALMLAQELLAQPKMSNHARGLWGYTGTTASGAELTVQSTGMGGPSAAVVLSDLAELGLRRAIRIGTCTSLGERKLEDLVIISEARAQDGTVALPDRDLIGALQEEVGGEAHRGTVASLDVLHRPGTEAPGADVADMQTAALLATAAELEVEAAALLIVSATSEGSHLPDEGLEAAAKRAGTAAASLL